MELLKFQHGVIIKMENTKKKINGEKVHKKAFYFLVIVFTIILLFNIAAATYSHYINGEQKFSIDENETTIYNILTGASPIQIKEGIEFLNKTNSRYDSIYSVTFGESWSHVPTDFENALIFDTNIKNQYFMEMCHWDDDDQKMIMCLNQGAIGRATTFKRSFQIVGNRTFKESDSNFTLCEGYNFIDCATDLTGADLGVQDDIEAGGSIYANENLVVTENATIGNLDVLGIMTGTLSLGSTNVNVSSGNITYSTFYMGVLGEGGVNDDIDNIIGGSEGDVVNVYPLDSGSDVKLKHGTGNLNLNGADCNLKSLGDKAELRKCNGDWRLITCIN